MNYIALGTALDAKRACLRELCGLDEQSVTGIDTRTAIQLLGRLLVAESDADLQPCQAVDLTVADRDVLLAAVYERTYGSMIESTLECSSCSASFVLDFSLPDLVAKVYQAREQVGVSRQADGTYLLPNGCCFRLPTARDEMDVLGMSIAEVDKALLSRCLIEGDVQTHRHAVEQAMEQLAPAVDLDLDACCPECDALQAIRFNLQSYLLEALLQDRARLAREVHRLATAYGWSLNEILSLTRMQRRTHVKLIEAELFVSQEVAA